MPQPLEILGLRAGSFTEDRSHDHLGHAIMQVERTQKGLRGALFRGRLRFRRGLWRTRREHGSDRENEKRPHRP